MRFGYSPGEFDATVEFNCTPDLIPLPLTIIPVFEYEKLGFKNQLTPTKKPVIE